MSAKLRQVLAMRLRPGLSPGDRHEPVRNGGPATVSTLPVYAYGFPLEPPLTLNSHGEVAMAGVILGQPNYGAIADLVLSLPTRVAAKRANSGLDVKSAAKQAGMTATTFAKFEAAASVPTQKTILAALRWLANQG